MNDGAIFVSPFTECLRNILRYGVNVNFPMKAIILPICGINTNGASRAYLPSAACFRMQ